MVEGVVSFRNRMPRRVFMTVGDHLVLFRADRFSVADFERIRLAVLGDRLRIEADELATQGPVGAHLVARSVEFLR